jgi:hypothetical protein
VSCFYTETESLFRFFCFHTETENFGVLTEPKQTGEQPKQIDTELNLVFFPKIYDFSGLFRFVLVLERPLEDNDLGADVLENAEEEG